MDPFSIRKDFPYLHQAVKGKPIIYFDNAATTQKPAQVLDTINKFYIKYNSPINRSGHAAGGMASLLYINAHENAARFIGAAGFREIIFTRNSTEAMNLVCYSLIHSRDDSLKLVSGDEIIITIMEHHSNFVPWQRLKEMCGIHIKIAEMGGDGTIDPGSIRSLVSERTRLICCTHVSNVLGTINPVKEIGLIARDAGILFLIDGTQSAPHMKVDMSELGADFFAFSGHKMLAPAGIGVLYGKRDLLERLPPFMSGGGMIKDVTAESVSWGELPWKFEAGTPDAAGAVAFGGAIDFLSGERLVGAIGYLESLGMDKVHFHEKSLCGYAISRLRERDDIVIYGPESPDNRCGIVSFNVLKGGEIADPHVIVHFLDEQGIAIRAGGHCALPLMKNLGIEGALRLSFYIYNTLEEIDRFMDVLQDIMDNKLL